MLVQITIKLTPTTRGELIDSYGLKYRLFRQHIEQLQAAGALPKHPPIRWLLDSARWEGHPDPLSLPPDPPLAEERGVIVEYPIPSPEPDVDET